MLKILWLLVLAWTVSANEEELNIDNNIRCSGMWSADSIPSGKLIPAITVRLLEANATSNIAIVIYNYRDASLLRSDASSSFSICTADKAKSNLCPTSDIGKFIIKPGTSVSAIQNQVWVIDQPVAKFGTKLNPLKSIEYPINKTDYYCIVMSSDSPVQATVEYRNPYGLLPASEYPKLPLYGLLSLVYLIIGAVWISRAFMYWRDLLPLQNYISMVIVFLMVEQAFNYGYYENYNLNGVGSTLLLVLVAILNAARNSVSFFILLIVSLGYGVVKPTLGETMKKCVALALAHLVFGIMYAFGSMNVTELSGSVVAIFILPLSMSMTIFYYWTLNALEQTMNTLKTRRQTVKLLMYTRLWRILIFSVCVLFLSFVVNALNFSGRKSDSWVPYFWKLRWILLDAWLNILYLIIFVGILILWRPTENNQRYGLDELAQDDDDFEAELNSFPHKSPVNGYRMDENEEDVLNWAEKHVGSHRNSFDQDPELADTKMN